MKSKFIAAGFAGLVLATGAFAQMGNPTTTTTTATMQPRSLYSEVSVGYVFDAEAPIYTLQGGSFLNERHYVGLQASWFQADDEDTSNALLIEQDLEMLTALFVYRYELPLSMAPLSLYLGAGAGVAFTKFEGFSPAFGLGAKDESNGDFAGEVSIGLKYRLTDQAGVKLGYRHFRVYDVGLFGSESDYKDDLIELGFSWAF